MKILNFDSTIATVSAGTAAAPSISFANDPNTGIYSPGADQVAISTGGTGRLFVDASGNIGIKTSSPFGYGVSADNLSNIQVAAAQYGVITLGSTTGGVGQKYWRMIGRGNIFQIQSMNDDGTAEATAIQINKGTAQAISDIQFYTNGVQRATISGASAVGGTSTPTSFTLDNTFKSGAASWDALKLNLFKSATEAYGFGVGASADLHYYAGDTSTGAHAFYTSRLERLRIDGSGRLLVGTASARANFYNTSISSRLQVEGANDGNSRAISCVYGQSNASGPILILGKHRSDSLGGTTVVSNDDEIGTLTFQGSDGTEFVAGAQITAYVDGTPGANDMPGRLVFSTTADGASSPTERMRIKSNGRISINNTAGNIGVVQIANQSGAAEALVLSTTSSGSDILATFRLNTNADGSGGNQVGSISVNTTLTSFNTTSDYRLKENVAAVTDGITRLQQLKPSRFNFIVDPSRMVDGFIAHEVQSIVPEAITGEKDAVDDEGNPVYQGIDQSKLVPLLTAALQEAVAKIESLEARLTAAGL